MTDNINDSVNDNGNVVSLAGHAEDRFVAGEVEAMNRLIDYFFDTDTHPHTALCAVATYLGMTGFDAGDDDLHRDLDHFIGDGQEIATGIMDDDIADDDGGAA